MPAAQRDIAIIAADLGLSAFRDRAALNAYESHPDHQKAVKDVLAPLTSKIVVYDILNQEY